MLREFSHFKLEKIKNFANIFANLTIQSSAYQDYPEAFGNLQTTQHSSWQMQTLHSHSHQMTTSLTSECENFP